MVRIEEDHNTLFKRLFSGWGLTARPCDNCRGAAAALLYCRVDAAYLCGGCDSKLHVARNHERVWLCEVCEQAPAAVTCKADAAALCSDCDADIHAANPLARRHERLPVVPFLDSIASATSTTVPPAMVAAKEEEEDDADTWLIPNPNFMYNNNQSDLLGLLYGSHESDNIQQIDQTQSLAFTDSVVPTQSKGNLSFSYHGNHPFENCFDIDFSQPNNKQQLLSAFNYSSQHSVSSSEIGVVPAGNGNSEVSYTLTKSMNSAGGEVGDGGSSAMTGAQAPSIDREARVLRYREKRKNRKFEKTIRYASRKAYAETRPRIKGRFAKRNSMNETSSLDIDPMYGIGSEPILASGSTGFLVDQSGYGVVPSF